MLLFFNVGVEVGQVVFVGAVLELVWGVSSLLRSIAPLQRDWLHLLQKPLAYTVGALAMYWTAARIMSFLELIHRLRTETVEAAVLLNLFQSRAI